MPFNLTGPSRAREIAQQVRLMAAMERALQHRVRRNIVGTVHKARMAYTVAGRAGLDLAWSGQPEELTRLLTASYRTTMARFGQRVFDAAGKSAGGMERKDAQGAFDQAVGSWISRFTAMKVQSITSTTRNQIISAIAEGEGASLGVDATARLITEKAGGAIARARAAIIARTETHAAATFGGDAAADATGIQGIKREWLAVEDDRTRPSHSAADGQRVGMEETFDVGGATLMRPGDPAGPAEETINCRCVLGYIAPGFE